MGYDPSYTGQQMVPAGGGWGPPAAGSGMQSNIMSLVYYRDIKDAYEAGVTAAAAFAALTFAATPTQTDANAIRSGQAAVNTQVLKALKSIQDQQLIASLLNAGNDPQSSTLAAVLLVR